jgi:mono/diheme cytochrome c family protein
MRRTAMVLLATCALTLPVAAQTQWLPQNWTPEDSQFYYTTPQGSKLILYSWALALERADSQQLWYENLERFYFLPNAVSRRNPNGLPVGIVQDGEHLGLTCAACHTNQLRYGGVTYQIDGGPTDADLYAFLKSLAESVGATAKSASGEKFLRFAERVLGKEGNTTTARKQLFSQLTAYNQYIQPFLVNSTPSRAAWGRARTDAFSEIFNRVTAIDLNIPSNNAKPDAPVSYPFLWDTSWLNKVQWNGIADNRNVIERLARNVGEVLGVFAQIDIRKPSFFHWYYESTAKRINMIEIEDRLAKLRAPKWQPAFGALDPVKVANGKKLYENTRADLNCIGCHYIATPGQYQDVVLTSYKVTGTDPAMTTMVATRQAKTGVLQGVRELLIFGPRMQAQELASTITGNAVIGALLSPFESEGSPTPESMTGSSDDRDDPARARLRQALLEGPRTRAHGRGTASTTSTDTPPPPHTDLRAELETGLRAMAARMSVTQQTNTPSYKARPLDGIWATAPYLHNGSVPTLWDLLSAERPKTFWVGTRQFDPVKVGFITTEVPGAFLFDTAIPGNLNGGHTWGTTLSESEKLDLIEYLKSL